MVESEFGRKRGNGTEGRKNRRKEGRVRKWCGAVAMDERGFEVYVGRHGQAVKHGGKVQDKMS
jgi:hypothetical protein